MLLCRVAANALPGLRSCDLSLIYSPLLLKLPVLAGARGYRGRRRLAAPCALPAL
ncbi:LysR family transcriptional regulator [Klebsiella sp. K-Nf6]|nr:LysR family transcriptional regulator [Klebsiella sp. K-Nf6]